MSATKSLEDRIADLEAKVAQLADVAERALTPVTISCSTNLDAFSMVRWPVIAAYPPRIGERIDGREWNSNKVVATLRVCGITHSLDRDGLPYLSIDLHK